MQRAERKENIDTATVPFLEGPLQKSEGAMQHAKARTGEVEEVARSQVESPASDVARFGADEPLHLDAGVALSPFQIGYKTYGTLNASKSNAILVCHALTGDQHVASANPVTGKPGWWSNMVGPGL